MTPHSSLLFVHSSQATVGPEWGTTSCQLMTATTTCCSANCAFSASPAAWVSSAAGTVMAASMLRRGKSHVR